MAMQASQQAQDTRTVKTTAELSAFERLNFLFTNRLPRRTLTLLMGRLSRVKNPIIFRTSLKIWQWCSDDFRLYEARDQQFKCLHDVFTRQLKPGARRIDTDETALVSPVDAIIGEFGSIDDITAIQAKGFPYSIEDLLQNKKLAQRYRNGKFITLRLKSSMYHRFHAPLSGTTDEALYISGDTWNVNPVALKVVEKLFCKNERVVLEVTNPNGQSVVMVAVAAILVASVKVHGIPEPLNLRYRGPNRLPLQRQFCKGDELGYFQHGSTFVLLFDQSFEFSPDLKSGSRVNMGQSLGTYSTGQH